MPKDWDDTEIAEAINKSNASDTSRTTHSKRRIIAAAEDVDLILLKLSQNGTDLDEAFKDGLIVCTNKVKSGTFSEETEKTFWINYAKLTRLAQPIHIDTLRHNENQLIGQKKNKDPISEHLSTLKLYRWIAIGSFFVMILALAYVSVAKSTLNSSQALKSEQLRLTAGLVQKTTIEELMKEIKEADAFDLVLPPDTEENTEDATADTQNAWEPGEEEEEDQGVDAQESRDTGEEPGAKAQVAANLAGNVQNLDEDREEIFSQDPDEVGEGEGETKLNEADENTKVKNQDFEKVRKDIYATALNDRKFEINNMLSNNARILYRLQLGFLPGVWDEDISDEGLVVNQDLILHVMKGYFLPLLASVLGVCVFIMRTGTEQIENMSFQTHNTGVYSHRLILGVVGGLVISWFSANDSTGTLNSLTPIALAFLVGYSVEILFNILDSILKALGAK
ncbi:hypothetical protein ROS1_60100 [Roseibium sp. ROS1]